MSTQKAVIQVPGRGSELRTDVPVPKLPGDKWMLIKTKAVALNPTDWKNYEDSSAGALVGCDYAGIVEEVGKAVTDVKVGDKVAGFARGGESVDSFCGDIIANSLKVTQQITPMVHLQNTFKQKQVFISSLVITFPSRMAQRWVLVSPPWAKGYFRSLAFPSLPPK